MAPVLVPPSHRPRTLVLVATAVGLEVLALVTAGVSLAVDAASGRALHAGQWAATGMFALLVAGLLTVAARAMWRLHRWGRGPVVTWQILQGIAGLSLLGSAPLAGVLVLGVAVAALAGTLAPASVRAMAGRAGLDGAGPHEQRPGAGRTI